MTDSTNTQDTGGLINSLLGTTNVDANIKVKLENDQYVYLALAMLVGVLLGSLFADIFKKMLGTN